MSELFLKIVNMSISATWLVLAVLALRLILKKAPKWVNVLLWGIVAVRLICPFTIESALSLIPSTETISPEIMTDWTPEISTGIEPLDRVVNPVITSSFAPEPSASANPLQILIPVAANIWLLGVLVMVIYTAASYWRLRRKVSTAVILRDNIFQCETVHSPFVLGLIKPRIYLPFSMDGQNLNHVVAHEQAHIRRKDHWWKPLGFLLLTIHWFNPLMWLAYILLCRDIELACDEKVIKELGNEQRADYSQALVACSVNRRIIAACPLAFGEVGVKERVKSVTNYKKPTFWIIVTALVVCVVVAVCFLTNPPVEALKALPEVHSHSYGIVEVTYESYNDKVPDMDRINGLRFRVTDDMVLGIKSKSAAVSYTGWVNLGTLTETELTRDNFDRICYHEDGWFKGESAAEIRKNVAHAWELVLEERGQFFYLIQMKNGELFLAEGYWDSSEKNDPGSDDTSVSLLYRIAVDLDEDYNLLAKSGEYTAAVQIYPADTAIADILDSIHWLNVAAASDTVPFRTYQNGEEVLGNYNAFETETYQPIEYHVPSGLEPQTYLFQNGQPGKDYIVIMKLSTEPDAPTYAFGVHFAPEQDSILQAKILEIHDSYYLVEPVEGSWELSSADRIEVPMKNMESSPEPEVGDTLLIEYDGQLAETYPARITNPYHISVLEIIQTSEIITAFEFNFAGNTSGGQKFELTEDKSYWCITIVNEGKDAINIDVAGDIYRVQPGKTGHIYPDDVWSPGTYSVNFGTAGGSGIEGYAICSISSVPFTQEEPLAWQLMIDPVPPSDSE